MTETNFTLRTGERIAVDSSQVKEVSSSDDTGRYATITLFDGTIYKVSDSFGQVMNRLSIKLQE